MTQKQMRPVLAVFIDGLKYTSLAFMPFLNSLACKRRLRTDLGYSITCHATMYTGVFPDKHKMWFLWQYRPSTSPFRWIGDNRLTSAVDTLPMRYFLGKMTRLFSDNTSYGGVGVMKKSSLRRWRYFDTTEKKLWSEEGYIDGYPTIFDLLRNAGIRFQTVGLASLKHHGGALAHIRNYLVPEVVPAFTYLFIGDADHVSHTHGQESPEAREELQAIDREVERVYTGIRSRSQGEPCLICWSDHGHMAVQKQLDIYEHFRQHGRKLDQYIHIIDINFARFWFRHIQEERQVTGILGTLPSGFVLQRQHYERYHVAMPDNRYGDMVYYLDHPFMFQKTVWGYGRSTVSIHGYLPDYPENDGVFATNLHVADDPYVNLVDIAPSLCRLLDIPAPADGDGRCLWK